MLSKVLEHINTNYPCGSDFKYDDIYLSVDSEIDKLNNIIEGIDTDWNKVSTLTQELLSEHTKDVKVLCWWTYSTWKLESWLGLEKTLVVFNTLLETYKETLFPKSKRVKLSSLEWLEEQLNEDILDENGSLLANIDHQKFFDIFNKLEKNFFASVQEEGVLFTKIQKALKNIIEKKEAETKANEVKKDVSNESEAGIDEIISDSDATEILRSLKKSANLLKNYWREQDHGSLGAVRLTRMLSWLETDGLPINDSGKAPLNAPSSETIDKIEDLYAEEKYTEALHKVESLISVSPFWLDGHLISFNILTALGDSSAALEVKNALISYINADRKILDLSFRDSTPFASAKLKEWIVQSGGSNESDQNANKQDNSREKIIEECYLLARKKNIKEAMKILQSNYASSVNKEEQFLWRISHAELAKEFGQNELAIALVEDLKTDIDLYKLDEWNPKLSSRVFALFLSFKRALIDVEELQAVYARLCKIDVEEALKIKI